MVRLDGQSLLYVVRFNRERNLNDSAGMVTTLAGAPVNGQTAGFAYERRSELRCDNMVPVYYRSRAGGNVHG